MSPTPPDDPPTPRPVPAAQPSPPGPGATAGQAADGGGWRSTASQGLLLARWTAAEVAAARVTGLAWVAWACAGVGLLALLLSIPADPGWPLTVLGIVLVLIGLGVRLTLALTSAILRRLGLPRRARHLRGEAVAARHRLLTVLAETGIPVSLRHAVGFVWALARGRRPHAQVASEVGGLSGRLLEAAEVARLRARLAEAVAPPPPGDDPPDRGRAAGPDEHPNG